MSAMLHSLQDLVEAYLLKEEVGVELLDQLHWQLPA